MNNTQLIQEKLAQATAILDELNVDAWLTFVRETSLQPDPALELIADIDVTWKTAFIVSRSGRHVCIIGHFDAENARNLGLYQVIDYHQGISQPLREALAKLDPAQIAINYSENDVAADGLSLGMYRSLQVMLAGTPYADRLISAEKIIAALRGRKSQAEIERVRQAVATTETLFDEVEEFVRPGMTQREIAEFVHGRIDSLGLGYAWPKPFNPIVTCGPESASGHAAPGDVALQKGHTLHMDLGVRQNDYCSDIQRMWYVLDDGETAAPPEVQRAFEVVLGAIKAGEAALRPGVPGWQVDAAARAHIVENGYPEYMHAFGHLLGRVAHDGATVLGPRWERYAGICDLPVEVGNIFTLELHVIVPERGMMSLEEDVLVTADGVEYLSEPQTSLRYIQGY
ncbi:MAG: aminopeptidase P family protein [Chloroflexi bacterium]|nr:aminopeptidase P family protein [Chloroflexota bacterium]MBK6710662.1 aminopeptidase P family protein [Chloroflexota bacterium]MBP6804275.1 aminopeptidase P family protein [Chloroflexota bacterium]MBP7592251.1 aminopeptidase P family protein [Chloroflexota bacterium]